MRAFLTASIAWIIIVALSPIAHGQEWTRSRGPNGAGISDAKTVPTSWTEQDYNWKVKLPAPGHSSPVLWGDLIFLTGADERTAERSVFALSAKDGKLLWSNSYASTIHNKHALNSFASPSAVCDADRVYFTWSSPDEQTVLALTHDNKEVWKRNLGPYVSQHGSGVSPILVDDLLILVNCQDKEDKDRHGESSILAMNTKTGETVWQLPRESVTVPYSTPCIRKNSQGQEELICSESNQGLIAITPKTGKVNWEIPKLIDKRSCSSPVITAGGLITISCGSGAGGNFLLAVHPMDDADPKSGTVAFKVDKTAPYVPTPIAVDNYLFMMSDNGVAVCVDVKTGKAKWKERIGGTYYGSPVCVDGKLYFTSADGNVVVIAASDKFEILATNVLGETCHSTPAVAHGQILFRTVNHLISLGGPKVKVAAK
jgi:outer membrane protein assembly factor BamB